MDFGAPGIYEEAVAPVRREQVPRLLRTGFSWQNQVNGPSSHPPLETPEMFVWRVRQGSFVHYEVRSSLAAGIVPQEVLRF